MFNPAQLVLSCALLVVSSSLGGEVQSINITWTRGLCNESCGKNLQAQFMKVAGVAHADVNASAAQMQLTWKPNVPFTFSAIRGAMAMIGLSMTDIHMKVQGTILHDDRSITLVSSGDNTRFLLLGPTQVNKQGYTITNNIDAHPMPPAMRQELLDAQGQNLAVTVSGPLFAPERSPPLYLIVDSLQIATPEKNAKTK